MIIYVLIALLLPFVMSKSNCFNTNVGTETVSNNKWPPKLWFTLVCCVFFKGFAFDTGADYISYFDYIAIGDMSHATKLEFGFEKICDLFRFTKLPPQLFFALSAFLFFYAPMKVASKYKESATMIVFFWLILFFVQSCNLYRQYFAFSFVYMSFYFYIDKKRLYALVWMFLAFSFHYSSLIVIPLFLICKVISKINIRYWMIAVCIILSAVSGAVFNDIIQLIYDSASPVFYYLMDASIYDLDELMSNKYETSYALIMSSIFLLWSYLGFKIKDLYNHLGPIYYLSIIYFILYPIFQQAILARILMYPMLFVPILVGIIASHYSKNGNRYLYFFFILSSLFEMFLFIYYLNYLVNAHPYRLIYL